MYFFAEEKPDVLPKGVKGSPNKSKASIKEEDKNSTVKDADVSCKKYHTVWKNFVLTYKNSVASNTLLRILLKLA